MKKNNKKDNVRNNSSVIFLFFKIDGFKNIDKKIANLQKTIAM